MTLLLQDFALNRSFSGLREAFDSKMMVASTINTIYNFYYIYHCYLTIRQRIMLMNDRFLFYNQTACSEVLLPVISDLHHTIRLDKTEFSLIHDIDIPLAVMDGQWVFEMSKQYRVLNGKDLYFERRLREGMSLIIEVSETQERILVIIASQDAVIPRTDKYLLDKKRGTYMLGSKPGCDIRITGNPYIEPDHGTLKYEKTIEGPSWTLECKSSYGIYMNGRLVSGQEKLQYGDVLDLYGFRIIGLGEILGIEHVGIPGAEITTTLAPVDRDTLKWLSNLSVYSAETETETLFNPPPRAGAEFSGEEIEIEGPPAPQEIRERSVLSVIGPSFTMVIPMLLGTVLTGYSGPMGLVVVLGSAAGMAFWAVKNMQDQKKETEQKEQRRLDRYHAYLTEKENEIRTVYNESTETLNRLYPSANQCLEYDSTRGSLWSRNPHQDDYYRVRLGIGELPLPQAIKVPQKRFSLVEDDLAEQPGAIRDKYEKMRDVPVGIDLSEHNVFGIIGGDSIGGCYQVLLSLIAQITANYNCSDVKIVFLCDGSVAAERRLLNDIKWFPHLWSDDKTMRYAGDSEGSIKEVLRALSPVWKERWEVARDEKKPVEFPRYIIITTSAAYLTGDIVSTYLFDETMRIGTNTFICSEDFQGLPNSCEYVIQNNLDFIGMYSMHDTRKKWRKVRFDIVNRGKVRALSYKLASIRVKTPEAQQEIPNVLTFLDMFKVSTAEDLKIEERWGRNRSYEDIKAPLGIAAGGVPCYLDVHQNAHGPHGLIAGMTGSGKSETIATWILALAVNYSPEDVVFLLVDFKGGGLVNMFSNAAHHLPHLVGSITNLGGNQINRALVSIRSESIRRQKLLSDAGANDVYDYAKLYKNHEVDTPLPHLLIVIDEFAELKQQFPDFMSELNSIAAIGRSLGIHLVLATQKPSGVVDDKINSNSRFRMCLKVQTPQDSKEMIARPDAASFTQKGRCILRVGEDEVLETFQSAWSRAPYRVNEPAGQDIVARLYTVTGKTEIVGTHQKMLNKQEQKLAWIRELIRSVEQVLGDDVFSLRRCLNDQDAAEEAVRKFYGYFLEKGWNITESSANDALIANLLLIYDTVSAEYGSVTPEHMLETARNMGRNLPEFAGLTQLDAVVDAMSGIAGKLGVMPESRLWLDELPAFLYLSDVEGRSEGRNGEWSLETPVGRYDDPEHQYQGTVSVDFANIGNYAVFGMASTGKSTLLQTVLYGLIRRYNADALNIYILDFSSHMLECFEHAPQVGGAMYENDIGSVGKLFYLMEQMIKERKQALQGGSYAQYMLAHPGSLPALLLVIDQYGAFREKTGGLYDTQMLRLAREGIGYGIYLMISGGGIGMSEIPGKLADNLRGRLCLQMNDKFEYANVLGLTRCAILPRENTRGRGLVNMHGTSLEFHTAMALRAANDFERSSRIEEFCEARNAEWTGRSARKIPRIPEDPSFSEFVGLDEVKCLLADDVSLPIGYDMQSALPYSLPMSRFFSYLISGKPRAGRTNFLLFMIRMAAQKGGKIYVFGSGNPVVKKTAEEEGAAFIEDTADLQPFCLAFRDDLARRNQKKAALEAEGYDEDELYDRMKDETPVFLFIEDLVHFTDQLYNPAEGNHRVSGFFETVSGKGWYHRIYFFAGLSQEEAGTVRNRPFYENMVRDKNGIHFGGNVAGQQLLRFDYISSFKEQSALLPPEQGLPATGDGRIRPARILIPAAKK